MKTNQIFFPIDMNYFFNKFKIPNEFLSISSCNDEILGFQTSCCKYLKSFD